MSISIFYRCTNLALEKLLIEQKQYKSINKQVLVHYHFLTKLFLNAFVLASWSNEIPKTAVSWYHLVKI